MLSTQWLAPSRNAPRLILAHGFTQNARCWGEFGRLCTDTFDTLAVDAPGHGWSGHDESDLHEAGDLIVEVGGRGHYVGYSMGGRMLLHAALGNPNAMQSLILIGATAGIESSSERAERMTQDKARAERILQIGTQAFVDEWLAGPMFGHLSDEQTSKFSRYENAPEGLAASLVRRGAGAQQPLWDQLSTLRMPVLVIAGSNDEKYTAIGKRMVATIGNNARFVNIEGGHSVHLENPAVTAAVVASWGQQLG